MLLVFARNQPLCSSLAQVPCVRLCIMHGRNLGTKMIQLFASGDIPGTAVHDLASAAWADGYGHDSRLLTRLAKAGSGGSQRSHVARDVLATAEAEGLVCSKVQPYEVDLSTGGRAHVYLPHEFYPEMIKERTWEYRRSGPMEIHH